MKRRWPLLLLVVGLACVRGPSDEEAAQSLYRDYRAALKGGDPERLKPFITADKQKELSAPDAAAKLQLAVALMPAEVRVRKTTVKGAEAVLEVEAEQAGQKMTGEVRLVKEGGAWQVDKESWSIKMDFTAMGGEPPFAAAAAPFLAEAQGPPQAHAVLEGHQGEISSLAFTPDGHYLISASYGDYSIRAWRVDTGTETSTARTENRVRDLAVSPDGKAIYTADAYKNVLVWPLENGSIGSPRVLVAGAGDALALSADGKLLATAGYGAPLKLWSAENGSLVKELGGAAHQRTLLFLKDGRALITGGDGNTYSRWGLAPTLLGLGPEGWQENRRTINRVSGGISSLDASRDGKLLATGHNDSSIVLIDLVSGREVVNTYVKDAATRDVAFSPDGAVLATAQQDKAVYLWDTRTGKQVAALRKHVDAVISVACSPDGRTLATGGEDRRIVLWRGGPPPTSVGEVAGPGGAKPLEAGAFAPGLTQYAGQRNFIKDPYAYHCATEWKRKGQASCEAAADGNPHFVLRYSGLFWQDAEVPESSGRYALLIARASSERADPDDQTGLPYLYGYMVNRRDSHNFNAHLNGQEMMLKAGAPDEWGTVWGVFPVPPETGAIRLYLQQADGGKPQNGSAARFDDAGVFLFDGEAEARAFAESYGR